MAEGKTFVSERDPVDGRPTRPILFSVVTTLNGKAPQYSMKRTTPVRCLVVRPKAECSEVVARFRNFVLEEFNDNATCRGAPNA